MVVFSCDGCGDVLKKNQVDAHAGRCRNCASVSCADCAVRFYGDDYRTHTTCITEAERYEKSVYRPNLKGGKQKRNPQEEWMDLIARAAAGAATTAAAATTIPITRTMQQQLQTLSSLGNVPRKEKQFRNFATNSLNLRSKKQMEELQTIWTYLNQLRNAENECRKEAVNKEKEANVSFQQGQVKEEEEATGSSSMEDIALTKQLPEKAANRTASTAMQADTNTTVQENDKTNGGRTEKEDQQSIDMMPCSNVVFKAVKKILKNEKTKCIKIKSLRTKLKDALGLGKMLQHEQLKKWMQKELLLKTNAKHGSKIKVNGKEVQLLSL